MSDRRVAQGWKWLSWKLGLGGLRGAESVTDKLSVESLRKAMKLLSSVEPAVGQTIVWFDANGQHSKRWGHRQRLALKKIRAKKGYARDEKCRISKSP